MGSIQLIDEKHPQGRFVLHRQGAALFGRGVPEQGQGRLGNIDAAGVAARLRAWWNAYRETGSVPFAGDDAAIDGYSHVRMAREYAAVLDSVIG